jgi:uncharacterized protein (DUF302 family)
MSADEWVSVRSRDGFDATVGRLTGAIRDRGLTVFADIDHARGAMEAGLPLRPTRVLIFGNAKGGTPLMQARQLVGIDLPLKALLWEDESAAVWVTHADMTALARRHGLGPESEPTVRALAAVLRALAAAAAGSSE